MTDTGKDPQENRKSAFEKVEAPQESLPREFLRFLAENKKLWLLPIILLLLLLMLLVVLSGNPATSPFIYTLF